MAESLFSCDGAGQISQGRPGESNRMTRFDMSGAKRSKEEVAAKRVVACGTGTLRGTGSVKKQEKWKKLVLPRA